MNREVYNRAIDTQHENTLVSPSTQENYGAITFLPLTICAEPPKDPNLVDAFHDTRGLNLCCYGAVVGEEGSKLEP